MEDIEELRPIAERFLKFAKTSAANPVKDILEVPVKNHDYKTRLKLN